MSKQADAFRRGTQFVVTKRTPISVDAERVSAKERARLQASRTSASHVRLESCVRQMCGQLWACTPFALLLGCESEWSGYAQEVTALACAVGMRLVGFIGVWRNLGDIFWPRFGMGRIFGVFGGSLVWFASFLLFFFQMRNKFRQLSVVSARYLRIQKLTSFHLN